MITIAHRGNISGKSQKENTAESLYSAVRLGYGIEFDLRMANGKLVVSHEPSDYKPSIDAEFLRSMDPNAFMAINIKEFGLSNYVSDIIKGREGFVFDFELIDRDCHNEMNKYRFLGFKIAIRLSDIEPMIDYPYDYVWIDEMNNDGSVDLHQINLNKCFYVSPELHGRKFEDKRSEKFAGICTDYCLRFNKKLPSSMRAAGLDSSDNKQSL